MADVPEGFEADSPVGFEPDVPLGKIPLSPYDKAKLSGMERVSGPFGPANPAEVLALPQVLKAPGAAIGGLLDKSGIMSSFEDIGADLLRRTGINPAAQPGQSFLPTREETTYIPSPLEQAFPKATRSIEDTLKGFATPGQIPLSPLLALKPMQALVEAQMGSGVPQALQDVYQAKTTEERTKALLEAGIGAAAGARLLKGAPNAEREIAGASRVPVEQQSVPVERGAEVQAEAGTAQRGGQGEQALSQPAEIQKVEAPTANVIPEGALFQGVRPGNVEGNQGKSSYLTDDLNLAGYFSSREGEAGIGRIDVYDPKSLPPLGDILEQEKSKHGSSVYSYADLKTVKPSGSLVREGDKWVYRQAPPSGESGEAKPVEAPVSAAVESPVTAGEASQAIAEIGTPKPVEQVASVTPEVTQPAAPEVKAAGGKKPNPLDNGRVVYKAPATGNTSKWIKWNGQWFKDKNGVTSGKPLEPELGLAIALDKQLAKQQSVIQEPSFATQKVQFEVGRVAQSEGQRPAKEVKSELVNRLEQAIADAPKTVDVEEKTATKAFGQTYVSSPDKRTKITIDIPGDGTFTVWNTKENLTELLARAKRISTKPNEPTEIRKRGTSKEDRDWVAAQLSEQSPLPNTLKSLTDKMESGQALTSAERKRYQSLRDKATGAQPEAAGATVESGMRYGPGAATVGDTPNTPRQAVAAGKQVEQAQPEHRPLGAISPITVAFDKAREFVKQTPTVLKGFAGHSLPKITAANREVGEAGVRYASSRIAARPLAATFSAKALQDTGVDPVKLGTALTEDNLRSVRESMRQQLSELRAAGKEAEAVKMEAEADNVATVIGSEGSPFSTEEEYLDFMDDPAVKRATQQHIQLWQEQVDPMFREAMSLDPDVELPARGLQTGARINLKAVLLNEEQGNPIKGISTSAGLTATFKRKSPFAAQAKGTGVAYDVDYHSIVRNTFEKQLEVANKNTFDDALVQSGNAKIDSPGRVVMIGDKPAIGFPLSRRLMITTKEGQTKSFSQAKNIYVRADLASEYRTASGVDKKWNIPLLTPFMTLLNRAALSGLTDATVHLSNQATALFNRPVSGNFWMDTLLSNADRADVPVTMVRAIIKAFKDNSEQAAELAKIGALRPLDIHYGVFGRALKATDRITRLVLDDAFKELVRKGLVENTETERREYVNQIGQYNRRLQGPLTRLLRDIGFGPFVTAGKTFNALGVKMVTLSPGAKASSAYAAAVLRANVLSKWIGGAVFVGTMNYLITHKVMGRAGTPLGNIDTGKNDSSGKQLSLPYFSLIGLGRGLRVTGLKGAIDSKRMGLTDGDAVEAATRDIINSWAAPAMGPGVKFGMVAASGYGPAVDVPRVSRVVSPGENQRLENTKEALRQASPLVQSYLKYRQGKSANEILSSQLPRFTMSPGKTEAMVSKYPKIVSYAQGSAFIDDMIHEARRMAKPDRNKFVSEQVKQLPVNQREHAIREVKRRHVYD